MNLLTPKQTLNISGSVWQPWVNMTSWLGDGVFGLQRSLKLELEGMEHIPDQPCIVATNHTHNYDFLPLRYLFYKRRKAMLSTWIKARAWQNPIMIKYLSYTGNVPLASRGYVISGDFKQLFGRKPSDHEYRALRNHIDEGNPLPTGEVFDQIQNQARSILGEVYSPSQSNYREAIDSCFRQFMESSLVVAERAVQSGLHQHINPQGTRSSRLTDGRPGVIHAAARLKLPILPVSILGMREALPNEGLKSAGGTIVVKCAEPYLPNLDGLSDTYEPFFVSQESDQTIIQHALDKLMFKINELCDDHYCMQDGYVSDGKQGVSRFL